MSLKILYTLYFTTLFFLLESYYSSLILFYYHLHYTRIHFANFILYEGVVTSAEGHLNRALELFIGWLISFSIISNLNLNGNEQSVSYFRLVRTHLGYKYTGIICYIVIEDRQKILNLGFMLVSTCQWGVSTILRRVVLLIGFELASHGSKSIVFYSFNFLLDIKVHIPMSSRESVKQENLIMNLSM